MFPLLAVLVLRYPRIHVSTSNDSDMFFYVKTPIDKAFCITATLNISDI